MEQDKKLGYLLMGGHTACDIAQGALSAVAAYLVLHYGFSYAQAAGIVLAANLATALVQPLFGMIGDRKPRPWIMALGIAFSGIGIAAIGLTSSYPLIIAGAMLSGLGVDMFHPEGGKLANLAAGSNKSGGMSIFSIGGNIGFAVGPVIMAAAVGAFGMPGMLALLIPSLGYSAVLLCNNDRLLACEARGARNRSAARGNDSSASDSTHRDRPGLFVLTTACMSLRSIINYGLSSFVALYMVQALGTSESLGSLMVTGVSLASMVGTLFSSRASGHLRDKRLFAACMAGIALAALALWATPARPVAIALIVLIGFLLTLSNPSMIVLGQEYLPNHLGLASGMLLGVAICLGGVGTPLMGTIADFAGVAAVFAGLAVVAALAFALVILLAALDRPQRS